jgi:hypothetical protein
MNEDLAKQRFLILNLARLSGLGLTLFGLLIIVGKVDIPVFAGYVIFVAGMFDMLIVPLLLTRAWKSPPK